MPRYNDDEQEPDTEYDTNPYTSERLSIRDTDADVDPARAADRAEDRETRAFFSEERGG